MNRATSGSKCRLCGNGNGTGNASSGSPFKIAASILSADYSRLAEDIKKVEDAGVEYLHIDVMDGHFVPNITIGPPVVKSLRKVSRLVFDVHLMIDNPDLYIDSFIEAGADIISVHPESSYHLHRCIQKIKNAGKKASAALNPATPLNVLDYVLGDLDMVLLMTVNPGFGGQEYIKAVNAKIESLRQIINDGKLPIDIEIDGGASPENIYEITRAGANVIVAGSAIFGSKDIVETVRLFREKAFKR